MIRPYFRIVVWHLVDDDAICQELPLLLAFLYRIFHKCLFGFVNNF